MAWLIQNSPQDKMEKQAAPRKARTDNCRYVLEELKNPYSNPGFRGAFFMVSTRRRMVWLL